MRARGDDACGAFGRDAHGNHRGPCVEPAGHATPHNDDPWEVSTGRGEA